MLSSRLKKAAGDLWVNRARSLLVLVAIAAVFVALAAGTIRREVA